jgi:hypothetical protein
MKSRHTADCIKQSLGHYATVFQMHRGGDSIGRGV